VQKFCLRFDLGRDIGATFNSAFESAVLAGEKFGDVLRGLAEDLLRLFLRRQVLEPLAARARNPVTAVALIGAAVSGVLSLGLILRAMVNVQPVA
jgi:hypothetical protein